MIRPSASKVITAAERIIQRHCERDSAPTILWAAIDDDPVYFALRNRNIIARPGLRVLAVVPYGFHVSENVQRVELPIKLLLRARGVPAGCKPISGSFATTFIATFWDRREALHQSRLVESLSGGGAVGAE